MKTLKLIGTASTLMIAQVSFAQITGTPHDFSGALWNTYDYVLPYNKVGEGNSQICKVCHTPHNASLVAAEKPLWNHAVSATAAYTLYSNSTFDGAATIGQPDGTSKMCLGCHDNTNAANRLDNYVPINGVTTAIAAAGNLGSDLSNDHPISFDYTAALATTDGGLYNPTTTEWNGVGSGFITNRMLFSNKVQCASCHNPHISTYQKFLRKSNTNSALCLTCHNK